MNIFICWSGDRSKALAKLMYEYLPRFIPDLPPPFFSENIVKGTRWFDEVSVALDAADAGLVCVTPESLHSGWIHFETGALARAVRKNRRGKVFVYLLNVEPDELRGPFGAFQSTRSDRDDTEKLIDAIVTSMGADADAREKCERAFAHHWGAFEKGLAAIRPPTIDELIPGLEQLFRRKTFNEPLDECTRQTWLDRYDGARQTLERLSRYRQVMEADDSHLSDLYHELVGQLDGYAMDMSALLLREEHFEIGGDGKVSLGEGVRRPCEERRRRIRQLVVRLLAADGGPVLPESRRFARLHTFEEKKALLIHPQQQRFQLGKGKGARPREETLRRCAASWWEFDRIYYYLAQEYGDAPDVARLNECLEQEFERLRAKDGGGSLIPLHYAVRALKKALTQSAALGEAREDAARLRRLVGRLRSYLAQVGQDAGGQVGDNLEDLSALLPEAANGCADARAAESPVA
ncbi:MAG TPA: TIR domain-containing protein [Pyrinomonadaceae bacterium]